MHRKLAVLVVLFSFVTNYLPSLAAENEPVVGAQAILSTIEHNEDGESVVTPVLDENGEQIVGTTDAEGKIIFDIPESFPAHKPLLSVAQPAEGEDGAQLTAFISPDSISEDGAEMPPVQQDPVRGAATNLVLSTGSTASEHIDLASMDPHLFDSIVDGAAETVKDVEPDSTTEGYLSRLGPAMGFQINAVLEEFEELNIPAEDKLQIAMNIDQAVAPDGWNVFAGAAPAVPEQAPAGGIFSAIIDPEFIQKHAPRDFDFAAEFGDHALIPGSVASEEQGPADGGPRRPLAYIPPGTFTMPDDLKLNPDKVDELKPGLVLAQGLIVGEDIKHLPVGTQPAPGTIFEGDIPEGIDGMPEGVIISDEKRAELEAAGFFKEFELAEGLEFEPSPGFALLGDFPAMPAGFGLIDGVAPAEGTKQLPPVEGYIEPEFEDGRQFANIPEFQPGDALPEGAKFPHGVNPRDQLGLEPPADFIEPQIGVKQENLDEVPGFDPFAFVTNPDDFLKPEVKDAIAGAALEALEAGTLLEDGEEIPPGLYNEDGSINLDVFKSEFDKHYQDLAFGEAFDRPEHGPHGKGPHGKGPDGEFDPSSLPEGVDPNDPSTFPEGFDPGAFGPDGEHHDGDFPEDFNDPHHEHHDGELGEFDPNGEGMHEIPEGVDPNDPSTWPEGFEPPKDGAHEGGEHHPEEGKPGEEHPGQFGDEPQHPEGGKPGEEHPPADGGGQQHPPADGGGQQHPPADGGGQQHPPADGGGQQHPPADGGGQQHPPADGGGQQHPPAGGDHPPQRVKALNRYKTVAKLASAEGTSLKVGQRTVLDVATTAKASKVTASAGVYLIGKAKTKSKLARLPVIIDPSTTSSSLKLTVAATDNSVDTTDITVENEATELLARIDGNFIEVVADDVQAEKVVGYLLAPGTSTSTMQKAIKRKGKVVSGDNGDIVRFKLPKKSLEAGSYTITYEDGDTVYYAKVDIGEIKARTVTVQVLAPNGQL